MDVVLGLTDHYFFTPYVYPESVPEDNIFRQFVSLEILVTVSAIQLYLMTATFSYVFVFDKKLFHHPQMLEVRVRLVKNE